MPTINITEMNTIRDNLRVLASFDGHRGLGGKGARKLHINTETGVFGTKDGYLRNIFQRHDEDSLLHPDTIATIKQMFENAINFMKNYTDMDKERDATRKLLFDGFRGLVYLAHHGYRSRNNYGALKEMIKSIMKALKAPLASIIQKGLTDQLWFETGVQVLKRATFSQSDFLHDPMGGICWGICMDWSRRILVKNKFSFDSSSKQNEWDQIIAEVVAYQKTQLKLQLDEIRAKVEQNPALTTTKMKMIEKSRLIAPFEKLAEEKLEINKATIRNLRYQKKGIYQSLAQYTQRIDENTHIRIDETKIISEKIAKLQEYRYECESKLNGTFKYIVTNWLINEREVIPEFSAKEKDNFRKAITLIDNAVDKIGNIAPITKAAEKFARMECVEKDKFEVPDPIVLCLKDQSDFKNYIEPMIKSCLAGMTGITPKAFHFSFRSGKNYAGIDNSVSHAIAFSQDPVTNTYYAMDPNFGEFSSQTVDGLVFIVCVLLSYYSFSCNIKVIETATISLTDIP
jgi:hypothetical protein